jgi:hypothetical protein
VSALLQRLFQFAQQLFRRQITLFAAHFQLLLFTESAALIYVALVTFSHLLRLRQVLYTFQTHQLSLFADASDFFGFIPLTESGHQTALHKTG